MWPVHSYCMIVDHDYCVILINYSCKPDVLMNQILLCRYLKSGLQDNSLKNKLSIYLQYYWNLDALHVVPMHEWKTL